MTKAKKKPAAKKATAPRAAAPKIKKAAKDATQPTTDAPVMLATQSIPLSQLSAWEGNVRKTLDARTLEELEASIPAHGLIQSLVVKPEGKNKFLVITGRHRLTALFALRDKKIIDGNYPVPCQIAADNVSLEEIGLAENIIRAEMNAADQYEVFNRLLTETEASTAAVAARFGVTETVVKKRMELGRLSPKILQGFRDGILNLEQLQAFTVCADKKKQERYYLTGDIDGKPGKTSQEELREIWEDKGGTEIRRELTETEIRGDDKRARFVGLDAYRAAGGQERSWLFAEDESGVYLLNPEILNRLVEEKLQQLVAEVKAEGWNWVEASLTGDFDGTKYTVIPPKTTKLSTADQKTVDDLKKKIEKIENGRDYYDLSDEEDKQVDFINDQIAQIENNAKTYAAKYKETGGAYVTMSQHGLPEITRGLIEKTALKKMGKEKEKAAKAKANGKSEAKADAQNPDSDDFTPDMSKKIMMSFTTHQTFAVGATVARNAEAGLCCLLHPLVMDIIYASSGEGIINARITRTEFPSIFDNQSMADFADTEPTHPLKGYSEMHRAVEKWRDRSPHEDEEQEGELSVRVLQWLFGLSVTELCELAALIAGLSLADRNDTGRRDPMTAFLMRKFNIDMAKWYSPRAENLFANLSKSQLLDIIPEIRSGTLSAEEKNYKKPALAKLAEDEAIAAEGRGEPWLPAVLRAPKTAEAGSDGNSATAAETPNDTPFKAGDVVYEIRGEITTQNMTVQSINGKEITCVWFEGKTPQECIYQPDELRKVEKINNKLAAAAAPEAEGTDDEEVGDDEDGEDIDNDGDDAEADEDGSDDE